MFHSCASYFVTLHQTRNMRSMRAEIARISIDPSVTRERTTLKRDKEKRRRVGIGWRGE